jgi:hypothetical protein
MPTDGSNSARSSHDGAVGLAKFEHQGAVADTAEVAEAAQVVGGVFGGARHVRRAQRMEVVSGVCRVRLASAPEVLVENPIAQGVPPLLLAHARGYRVMVS